MRNADGATSTAPEAGPALEAQTLPAHTVPWIALLWVPAVAALSVSAIALQADPTPPTGALVVALLAATLAALLRVRGPRGTGALSALDLPIALSLLHLGAAAAVLVGAAGAACVALRTVKPWRGRLFMLAQMSNGFAALVLGFLAWRSSPWLQGVTPGLVDALALCLAAPLQPVLVGAQMVVLQRLRDGQWPQPRRWLGTAAIAIALGLFAALVAGLVTMSVRAQGGGVLWMAAVVLAVLIVLLRLAYGAMAKEHRRQETDLVRARLEAARSEQRYTAAFTHGAIGNAILGQGREIVRANPTLAALVGLAIPLLEGRRFEMLVAAADRDGFQRWLDEVEALPYSHRSAELHLQRADGSVAWVQLHATRTEDPAGPGHCLILQVQDCTQRREAERQLQHIAYHDTLTGLPNRHRFVQLLSQAVAAAQPPTAASFGVLYLDLDRFKLVNDSMGHEAGNQLLQEMARRLRGSVGDDDVVARLGGDEFAVLMPALQDTPQAQRVAERICAAVALPVRLRGQDVQVGVSIGITVSSLGHRETDEVMRDADLAMYAAKEHGRGKSVLFDANMHRRVIERSSLEAELRNALAADALTVQFQPIWALDSGEVVGFEALLRWRHPTRGAISPGCFVPLAEEHGYVGRLTTVMLEQSVAALARWHTAAGTGPAPVLHANVSAHDLVRADLPGTVLALLRRHGLPAQSLVLEITETALMSRLDVALACMHRLQAEGVRFCIDDFGTGYSSLSYLGTLPIESLKIDRSFVDRMLTDPRQHEIVRAITGLARSMGRRVVAEGVETVAQLAALQALGIDEVQGYLLAHPLEADAVPAFMATRARQGLQPPRQAPLA